jgi:threonine synthase
MKFYSTSSPTEFVDLKEAVLRSLPADNGLYMPEHIPSLDADFWNEWRELPFAELGFRLARGIFEDIPEATLRELIAAAIDFDAPLVTLAPHDHVLELFHGPTLAFKDFGARFMARVMGWLTRDDARELTVLVATSGDTGGAVASAFHRVPGTRVVILYPKGKVSGLQEKQLTTLGDNISALEIDGTFDDCQRMVKAAFLDRELSERLNLTSANSINISRLVPQAFYYFHAVRQLPAGTEPVFVVPSGNFGNLTAGLLAQRMGLPVKHFVAATNRNDVVPAYLESGDYQPRPSVATLSNAMDVGAPSNFIRLLELCGRDWGQMCSHLSGFAFSDEETQDAIRQIHATTGYVMDPHGAVGWLAAGIWRTAYPDDHTIVLETAHPAKFLDVMTPILGTIPVPERLACLETLPKVATAMPADPAALLIWLQR